MKKISIKKLQLKATPVESLSDANGAASGTATACTCPSYGISACIGSCVVCDVTMVRQSGCNQC